MTRFGVFAVTLCLALVASAQAQGIPRSSKMSKRMAAAAARGGNFYEVTFSDAEESVLKAQQGDTVEMIARRLTGRSVQEVQRRCIELGLRCGVGAEAPPKGSEKWRMKPKRQ